ncbi:exopolysaccharide biosynthesis polyprenyl glycosylphosphotransferase [Lutibacter sp. TH_r2]|uniref:exopolysaccharide biosynthesis polyprenyl glycosylphosphotransferase n=1 Tax=Lutibacter sp. TH_r2 TaxID=3082083 RepID=UPI002953DDBF|nr:exopolysaccharide biosynthesis polyprenyl glycosylphosphotransferase [Lutibacter sp. TH_r2]MDV7187462.1 exopolysaccharide biosynthesis polyprenyl glycosylphosphotransferase [Lutibacter sp. TH_r2]
MPQSKNFHFSISERKVFLRVFDVILIVLGLYGLNFIFEFEYFDFNDPNLLIWILVLIFYYYLFGQIFELFNLNVASDRYLTLRSVIITVIFTSVFYVFTPKISPILPENRLQIVYFSLTIFTVVMVNRLLYILLIFSPRFYKNILVIGDEKTVIKIIESNVHKQSNKVVSYISDKPIANYSEIPFSNIETVSIAPLISIFGVNEILVCSNNTSLICEKVNNQLINLFEKGMSIRSIDNFLENETSKISENQLKSNFYDNFSFSKSHENNLYLAFRRIVDIIFAIGGILGFIIMIPIVFVLNLIGNRGKLFYLQNRVGKKGQEFNIIKFRTMIPNAEKSGAQWATKADSRITPIGRILRKTRLDEVPQFINILKGDMSLIGPRPERPEFVKTLEKQIPYYGLRHVIKPGLTGWAQVMHPYAHTVEDQKEKLMFDLYYIKQRNLVIDLKIIIKTISTVLFFRGT